jgi:hypothetical protein
MAIEDGIALAALLPLGTPVDAISSRLQLYLKCRKERVERIQTLTRQNGRDPDDPVSKRLSCEFCVLSVKGTHEKTNIYRRGCRRRYQVLPRSRRMGICQTDICRTQKSWAHLVSIMIPRLRKMTLFPPNEAKGKLSGSDGSWKSVIRF